LLHSYVSYLLPSYKIEAMNERSHTDDGSDMRINCPRFFLGLELSKQLRTCLSAVLNPA